MHTTLLQNSDADAIIIRGTDMHGMEMPHSSFMLRHVLSDFYGSAGTLLVHKNGSVGLWTDSRYELSAQRICAARNWDLTIQSERAWEQQVRWVAQQSRAVPHANSASIMLCELQFSQNEYEDIASYAKQHGYALKSISYQCLRARALTVLQAQKNARGIAMLSDEFMVRTHDLWHLHDKRVPYNAHEKLRAVYDFVKHNDAQCFISADIHEIAYSTGLRATILPYLMLCPCVFALVLDSVSHHMQCVFIIPQKLCTSSFAHKLHTALAIPVGAIHTIAYETLLRKTIDISHLTRTLAQHKTPRVLYDPVRFPMALVHALQRDTSMRACGGSLKVARSPLRDMKDIRSDAEIGLIRESIATDCAAILEAMHEVVQALTRGETLYEKCVSDIVQKHRKKQSGFLSESFQTISAAGSNGALPHYAIEMGSGSIVKSNEPYLLDCGAHYACKTHAGTTDITRSFLFSHIISSQHESTACAYKEDYTAVLKAHIALATSVFESSTTGAVLHEKAQGVLRQQNNRSYGHGTGHGVGFCTDVHEGEQTISKHACDKDRLAPNMVFSNEPGYYVKNLWGVRLENMVRVCKSAQQDMLAFETLTFFPFQQNLVVHSKLTNAETTWLANYQATCMRMLENRVSTGARALLEKLTQLKR